MVGPLEPAGLNFVGLTSPGPNVATGTVDNTNHEATPVAGSTDVVQISPQAQDAARAVTATKETTQKEGRQASGAPVPGSLPALEKERAADAVEAERARPKGPGPVNLGVTFNVDNPGGVPQVRVVDRSNQEVVRSIPPDDQIAISAQIQKTLEAMRAANQKTDKDGAPGYDATA